MDDDLLPRVADEVADLWDEAFQCAAEYGGNMVGIEHLLVALTSVPRGAHLLARRGVDVAGLQARALWLIASSADEVHHAPPPITADDDLDTALALAVEIADERHGGPARCEDVLAALDCYEAADAALAQLAALTRVRAFADTTRHVRHGVLAACDQDAAPTIDARARGHGDLHADVMRSGDITLRLAKLEREFSDRMTRLSQQVEDDRQRIAHTLRELSRQRERLPQAEDWRSQMQEIVVRIDALAQRQREAELVTHKRARGNDAPHSSPARDMQGAMIAGIMEKLEQQQREIERLTAALAQSPAGHQMRSERESGLAVRSGFRRAPRSRAVMSGPPAPMRGVRRTLGRGMPRQRRRFGGLRFASVIRSGLKRRPVRRERSWWRYMTDMTRWRAARRRGGRFIRFGERHSGRRRVSSRRILPRRVSHEMRVPQDTPAVAPAPAAKLAEIPEKRFYLSIDDDIVDAPSIGPRTAERLRPARIFTVRDLLAADPDEVGSLVTARHITAQAVRDWQDQSRLVITVPFLRGTHAQLLVGAGFRSAQQVAEADQATLMSALLKFATSRDGQGILRNGPPPDIEKVLGWMRNAADAEIARAA